MSKGLVHARGLPGGLSPLPLLPDVHEGQAHHTAHSAGDRASNHGKRRRSGGGLKLLLAGLV